MSLATLKAKVQKLIDKARYGNIYKLMFTYEDIALVIPDDITVIESGNYAPLSTISTSGKNVEQIITDFFNGCESLNVADFPKLKSIGNDVFYNCIILETINMPLLQSVGSQSFYQCSTLKEINAPNLVSIGASGFSSCGLITINLPNLTTMENSAFSNCADLTEINTPNLVSIGASVIFTANKVTKMTVGALNETSNVSFKQVTRGTNGALTELYVGQGTSADLYLQYSEKYPQSILHGIIENLADLTGKTAGVFYVGDKNLEKIDSEHKAMLESKNWIYK